MALEDIDKNFSKISQAQDTNFENNKNTIECCTDLENVESESATTNEQTVPGCGLGSDKELDISCNVGKHPIKIVGEESDAEENLTNSANTLTEEIQQSLNNTENSLLYDTRNTASYESVCTEHTSDCLETLNTTHKNLRKRNTSNSEVSKHVAKSGEEIVIRHEHCEKLDNVSTDNSFQDTGIVSAKNQLPMYSNQELKNTSSQKPVDLPVHSVQDSTQNSTTDFSLLYYLNVEVTRGYLFEEQEEKYLDQREKVYTFMKTPRELEKLMWFGFLLCVDCFLFVFTYLPIRVLLAILKILGNVVCLKFLRNRQSFLEPYQMCDLLRGLILLVCCFMMNSVDLSILYHIVRGQSVIKLYVIYNMLDIADRLFSSIGQDTLDVLFWTAAEKGHSVIRIVIRIIFHFGLASAYVFFHAVLVLFQAITLNVAINSHNKVLMVVMISNQFVELKGCVFKKFEKNNLFQMSCADIRERFYYVILVSLVTLRNMHELQWNLDHLYELMPPVAMLLCSEVVVDWVKHAFITKFNCISSEVYHEYRELLALDAATSRLFGQQARSDHFDLVSRRLGFIPLPLACVVYRVTSQSVKISGTAGIIVLILVYLWLTSVKILNSIILLGLSSHYVMNKTSNNKENKPNNESSPSPSDLQLPVADPLDRDQSKVAKVSKPRQVKALNEIDRYTLCSNRIV